MRSFCFSVTFDSETFFCMFYQYLELRFNIAAKRIVAVMVPLGELFYMGITIYMPALALNAVSPIPLRWSIAGTSIICTFYTTLGGMKAVIWTDVVQAVLMVSSLIAAFICGLIATGGFEELSISLERGGRLTFFNTRNFDISSRMSIPAITFGEFFVYTHYLSFSQPIFQRIQSCKTQRQSAQSLIAYVLTATTIVCFSIGNGLTLYSYFEGCDPVYSGKIERLDQAAPLMALQVFKDLPGMSGIFIAAVFSGTLSTVSSGLNAYSAVILEDFVASKYPNMTQRTKLFWGKVFAVILGGVVMTLAYAISAMSANIFKSMRSVLGSISGPVLGLYLLGMFIPWTTSLGAITGTFAGLAFMIWILIGSNFLMTMKPTVLMPPISTDQCTNSSNDFFLNLTSTTAYVLPTSAPEMESYPFDQILYSVNFHYYIFMGSTVTVIVGLLVSLITGPQKPSDADPELFIPLFDNQRLPAKVRRFFRFGVPERKKESVLLPEEVNLKALELQHLSLHDTEQEGKLS